MKIQQKGYVVDVPKPRKGETTTQAIAYVRRTTYQIWKSEVGCFEACVESAQQWLEQAKPLEHGPYTDEQIAEGRIAIGDLGAFYGYCFQVVQLYDEYGHGICAQSWHNLPCFEQLEQAIAYLEEQPFMGMIMRYVRNRDGSRSKNLTAGRVYVKESGDKDYWKPRVEATLRNPPEFAFGRNYWVVREREGETYSWLCEAIAEFPAGSYHFTLDLPPEPLGTIKSFQFVDVDRYREVRPVCLLPEVIAAYQEAANIPRYRRRIFWGIRTDTPRLPGEVGDHRQVKTCAHGNTREHAEVIMRLRMNWDESVQLKVLTEHELKEH